MWSFGPLLGSGVDLLASAHGADNVMITDTLKLRRHPRTSWRSRKRFVAAITTVATELLTQFRSTHSPGSETSGLSSNKDHDLNSIPEQQPNGLTSSNTSIQTPLRLTTHSCPRMGKSTLISDRLANALPCRTLQKAPKRWRN